MPYRLLSVSVALALTECALAGCSVVDSRMAQRAETALVGLSEIDLEGCLGVPNRRDTFDQTTILTYDGSAISSGGFNVTLPVVGGLNFTGGGYCRLTARIDKGRVTSIRYAGEIDAPLAPEAYCAPLVRSCMDHPPPRPPPAAPPPVTPAPAPPPSWHPP